jgi:hypothetical protein
MRCACATPDTRTIKPNLCDRCSGSVPSCCYGVLSGDRLARALSDQYSAKTRYGVSAAHAALRAELVEASRLARDSWDAHSSEHYSRSREAYESRGGYGR